MPGGYGDDTSLPWTGSGDIGASWNTPSSNASSGNGGGWTPGAGRDESGYLPTSPHYGGDGSEDGTGVNNINNIIGTEVVPQTPEQLQTIQDDKVWAMAELEASNEKYAKSYEGKLMLSAGYKPGDKEWTAKFGLGSIVATNIGDWNRNEQGEWKFTGQEGMRSERTGDYIYTGLGQTLLDQGDITGSEGYEQAKGDYWKTRTEQEQSEDRQQQQRQYGYFPDPGGGYRGRGYAYGDTEMFDTDVRNYWRDVAGTPMLPVAGSGAGASMAAADELYSLAAGNKAFSNTPAEQGILAILNA